MPQIFFPEASRSLGHLILVPTPISQSALATPTAAVWVMREARLASNPGRNTMDIQSPPLGEPQWRPSRPLPPVWISATTSVPCGVPARASPRARSWVEASPSLTSTTRARGLRRPSIPFLESPFTRTPALPALPSPRASAPPPARAARRASLQCPLRDTCPDRVAVPVPDARELLEPPARRRDVPR